jgi:glutathione synthase
MTRSKLKTLFVMDPITNVNPDKDSTFLLLMEAQARGHTSYVCGIEGLSAEGPRGFAHARPVSVMRPAHEGGKHADEGALERIAFDDLDVIWMRKDPPVDDAYLFACMLLDRADRTRTLVFNDPSNLRVVHEKLWALGYEDLTPKTVVSSRPDVLVDFVKSQGRGVLKPLHLMGGMGVFAFDANDKNLRSAADLLTLEGKRPAIAQEFLPEVTRGDKRVILVDGEPIGALLRVPRGDDVRSNLHVGGSAQPGVIDDDDRRIAARIGPTLKALGMFFVGIDVIGGRLTEVNVTSPTGLQEIDRLDGRAGDTRMGPQIWSAVEGKLAR